MAKREIRQGDVYMCNLGESVGSEQKNTRPILIVSTNSLNENRSNVIIAPITSSMNKKNMINHYCLFKDKYDWFTHKNNIALLECVRDISNIRLERYLGTIDEHDINEITKLIIYDFVEYHH